MRRPLDAARLRAFMRALGAEADRESRVYLTGGATAVLLGWRESTIDVDLKLEPETDRLLRALASLKETLELNMQGVKAAERMKLDRKALDHLIEETSKDVAKLRLTLGL